MEYDKIVDKKKIDMRNLILNVTNIHFQKNDDNDFEANELSANLRIFRSTGDIAYTHQL